MYFLDKKVYLIWIYCFYNVGIKKVASPAEREAFCAGFEWIYVYKPKFSVDGRPVKDLQAIGCAKLSPNIKKRQAEAIGNGCRCRKNNMAASREAAMLRREIVRIKRA